MTFNLIAIFSGLVSYRTEAASPYSPVLRSLGGKWRNSGGEYCLKIMTEMEGPLSIKVVRKVNGREQGSPVVRRTMGQAKQMLGCSNDPIVRVDVWSGSQNGLWRGKILTTTPKLTPGYCQMRPTNKWNPHWNGIELPCSENNSFQVTGQLNYNCEICACLQTGPSRICSLITSQEISNTEGSNQNWLVQPTSSNYVAATWKPKATTTRAPRTTRRPRPPPNPCSKNSIPGTKCAQNCECKSNRCGLRTWFGWISRNKCC
jgi:hypothetical protein